MPAGPGRGWAYRQARARLLASAPVCVWCRERPATTADHVPPLSTAPHPDLWVGELVPACAPCNMARGAAQTNRRRRRAGTASNPSRRPRPRPRVR